MRVCGNPRATFAALLAGLALGTVPAAHALTFTVNSQADAPAGGVLTNGVCETAAGNGVCTLRAALQKANAVPGVSVTIVLPAGTYGRIGDYPTITVPLTIQGAGVARTIIDAAYAAPSSLPDGLTFQANGAMVSGITIRGARGTGIENHGMLTLQDSQVVDCLYGGVHSTGTMTIRNSAILRNYRPASGGGLSSSGQLTVIDSLIADNSAPEYSYGATGGVVVYGGVGTFVNTTISNNWAYGAGSGGISIQRVDTAPVVELVNSTIAGNQAQSGKGAGIWNDGGVVRMKNSLVTDNYVFDGDNFVGESDCDGPLASLGYNWVQAATGCSISGAGSHDRIGGDPRLDELRGNGGPTPTRGLLAGSAAIDAIPPAQCTDALGAPLTTDQRGFPRPSGSGCDIGAFEGSVALPFNVNLIRNGGGEDSAGLQYVPQQVGVAAPGGVPHWTTTGDFSVIPYGTSGFPAVGTDLVQPAHGVNFFSGGNAASSTASQTIPLTAAAAAIDTGKVRYYLSGDFGGFSTQNDRAQMNVTFRDAGNNTIGNAIGIGNFVAANRNNRTGLLGADFNGLVPVGTRSALVELLMTRAAGTNNDGYADNLSLILSGGATTPDLDQHGLTGSWYEPETSGQGLEVEDFPDLSAPGSGLIQVSWFTFDDTVGAADHERWYTASGPVVAGQSIANLTIYQNVGGNFDAPPVTSAQAVGKATLSFDTCASGVFSYTFNDESGRAGVIPLTRLTQNVTCSTTSVPRTDPDFVLSGNWYDPATSGQGLMIEVNPNSHALFAAWYTYAPGGAGAGAAGQRWFTAEGDFVAGARSIPITIYETTLALFDAATFPFPSTVAVGSGTLTFQSCADAVLNFDFTGGSSSGKAGIIGLVRVGPVPPGCFR